MINAFGIPSSIPADQIELLRHLISDSGTNEQQLEDWIRKFPQVINRDRESLFPKTKFMLPEEPDFNWEPDILFNKMQEGAFDIIELKRADIKILTTGKIRGFSRWVPSSPPKFSSAINKALNQLDLYLTYTHQYHDILEEAYKIDLVFPKGLLIAGREINHQERDSWRYLKHKLSPNVEVLTWGAILKVAEKFTAHKLIINIPCVTENNQFHSNINEKITEQFFDWTGFSSPYLDPLKNWRSLYEDAQERIRSQCNSFNIDFDEDRKIMQNIQARIFGDLYYRIGKYCISDKELQTLTDKLPKTHEYLSPRSFTKGFERMNLGYQDAKDFVEHGSKASTVEELKESISQILQTRKKDFQEPDSYYRNIITRGYLEKNLFKSNIQELLEIANWINPLNITVH